MKEPDDTCPLINREIESVERGFEMIREANKQLRKWGESPGK